MNEIWVVILSDRLPLLKSDLNSLAAGRICKQSDAILTAILPCGQLFTTQDLSSLGVDRAIYAAISDQSSAAIAHFLHFFAQKRKPSIILLPADSFGRETAAQLAARLNVYLFQDCIALKAAPSGKAWMWTRPCMSGQRLEICQKIQDPTLPQLATIASSSFWDITFTETLHPVEIQYHNFPSDCAAAPLEKISQKVKAAVNLENAEIIVSGGRGLGGPEGFQLLSQLAEQLHGTVGASRAAVDAGWIDHAHQIGQSGKTVTPRLYIACGISGSIQHQSGMRAAHQIIAINTDPSAPIFKIADYGIVGDLYTIIPALISLL